jgi:UPF0716 family protein affecting phage T7 exclusion
MVYPASPAGLVLRSRLVFTGDLAMSNPGLWSDTMGLLVLGPSLHPGTRPAPEGVS